MTRARLLFAALAVSAFAAAASAQTPATAARTGTPATAAIGRADIDTPTAGTIDDTTPAVPAPVDPAAPAANPWAKWYVPGAAFLAVLVIALFVIRWQRTGEIPSDRNPRAGDLPPDRGPRPGM